MKSQSSVMPERIAISSLKEGKRKVYLRRDIKKLDNPEGEEEAKYTLFEYEEVCIEIQDRDDLRLYVDSNFDELFEKALEKEYEEKTAKIRHYLKVGDLVEEDIDFYVASGILRDKQEVL